MSLGKGIGGRMTKAYFEGGGGGRRGREEAYCTRTCNYQSTIPPLSFFGLIEFYSTCMFNEFKHFYPGTSCPKDG